MSLQIATVLSCTETICLVQPIHEQATLETEYSKPILKYNIPIRPTQFVIVDRDTTPPETIFRWSRGNITRLNDDSVEVEMEGKPHFAKRANTLEVELQVGDEVIASGFNDENRQVIDIVVDGVPAHADRLGAEWFPMMATYARDHES